MGSSVGQAGHSWVQRGPSTVCPWEPKVDVLRWEMGWSAWLLPPKALGPLAAIWERPSHDYFRVAENDASHLDIDAQTMSSPQRMTSQSQPAPPPSHVGPHSMWAEAHWQGVQRNEMERGRRSRQAPSDQWADLSLRRLLPCHWASASGEEKKGVGERALRPGLEVRQEGMEQRRGLHLGRHVSGACPGSTVLC